MCMCMNLQIDSLKDELATNSRDANVYIDKLKKNHAQKIELKDLVRIRMLYTNTVNKVHAITSHAVT
jgi:hypothetical protein